MTVWDQLIGQDDAVAILRGAAQAAYGIARGEQAAARATGTQAASGAMTHAWLFVGPAGSGRSVAARAFAAALQCERPDNLGCGECTACHTVLAGTHLDVRMVVPEGLSISVAETRDLVAKSARLPVTGRWQVVIIEDADRLGERASNALLKAIEEPAPRTVFMLCSPSSHPDDVAVTIRSRCRYVPLRTPSTDAVAAMLVSSGLDEATASWAAAAAQGHIGRARRLARDTAARGRRTAVLTIPASLVSLQACLDAADHLVGAAEAEAAALTAELDANETESLQVALGAGGTGKGVAASIRGAAGALRDLEKRQKSRATRAQRDALDRALVDLAAFYRDVLLHQTQSDVPAAHPDLADDVALVASRIQPAGTLRRLDAVLACREAVLDLNVKPRIAVEAMTATLRIPSAG